MSQQDAIILIVIAIGVLLGIFFIVREIFCWYYRINERVKQNDEIIRLLKKIAGE